MESVGIYIREVCIMSDKSTLCKLVKKDHLEKHFAEYEELVVNPEYICRKCGRAANDKKSLCKPVPIGKKEN